jgi:ActR/RegA family two-component response regulator
MNVLVVDDDPLVQRALGRQLTRVGAGSVSFAGDLKGALLALEAHGPALALVDMNLEWELGTAVVDALRAAKPTLAIVLMSGAPPPSVPRGATFVPKPFPLGTVKALVEQARAVSV